MTRSNTEKDRTKRPESRWRFLLSFCASQRGGLSGILLITICNVAFTLGAPLYMSGILNEVSERGVSDQIFTHIPLYVAIYFGLRLAAMLCYYFLSQLAYRVSGRATLRLRQCVFRHVQKLPISYFDHLPSGKIASRICSDSTVIQNFYEQTLTSTVMVLIQLLLTLVSLCFVAWQLNLFIFFPILLVLPPCQIYFKRHIRKPIQEQRRCKAELSALTQESLSNIELVHALSAEDYCTEIFDRHNQTYLRNSLKGTILDASLTYNVVSQLEQYSIAGFLLFFGLGSLGLVPALPLGLLYLAIDYSSRVYNQLHSLASQVSQLERGLGAAEHILDVLGLEAEQEEGVLAQDGAPPASEAPCPIVEARQLHFAYTPEQPVLQGINFQLQEGQTLALVGDTGSGKTTLINLLQRFYTPSSGALYFRGQAIQDIPRQELRTKLALVQQDPFLLSSSIYENIRMGNPKISEADALEALEAIGAKELILRQGRELHSQLKENGQELSSGERQLISFARAFAHRPEVLILDEATAHIDSGSEQLLQDALGRLLKHQSSIVIAHRLSTIRNAEQILVLQQGKIIEQGTHEELLALKGHYVAMLESQSLQAQDELGNET